MPVNTQIMKFDSTMFYILPATFAPAIVFFIAVFWDRAQRKKSGKPPQTEKLLRPPGHSLALQLDKTIDSVMDSLMASCAFSALAGGCVLSLSYLLAAHAPVQWLPAFALPLALFVIVSVFFAFRAWRRFKKAQRLKLGLRGEQAVAESLGEAADSGFRAFHDLPGGENWNIDHVAVGTRGVFLIETKTRRRRTGRNPQPAHEVIFNGDFLQFPAGKDTKSLKQAQRNAAWLSNYLAKKTGDPVRVEPLVVLPGWFVRISEKGNFPVKAMNANYLAHFLSAQPEVMPPAQVRRIITALDDKCRDLEF
jgi:TRAP-type C4-dicarboxylate transport system permease small subunit